MSLSLFVLSHDPGILAGLPDAEHIVKVNLEELDIPEQFKGQSLSENRFFLSSHCDNVTTDFVGVVSGRYEERYPFAPGLDQLDAVASQLKPGEYFTPWARTLRNKSELELWVNTQDGVHPGMASVLNKLFEYSELNSVGTVFGGNQLILPRAEWDQFVQHWRTSFEKSIQNWGKEIPFSYRCWNCGSFKPNGFHTYGPKRHLGFLGERITALFFAMHAELKPSTLGRITSYNQLFARIFSGLSPKALEMIWVTSKLPVRFSCKVCK
jgi:hypothetical protein